MTCHPYEKKFYAEVAKWWQAHEFPPVPEPILPASGVVVMDGDIPRAATWLYLSNSNCVGMMEYTVTNPGNSPKQSLQAIAILLGGVRELAKALYYTVILTSAKQPSLIRLYERGGFLKTDEAMTHLVMVTHPDAIPAPHHD